MNITKNNQISKNTEKNYIHKGARIFPDLDTAILANLKGFINGSYPHSLPINITKLGYYPLSMANEEELKKINNIKTEILSGNNNGKNT